MSSNCQIMDLLQGKQLVNKIKKLIPAEDAMKNKTIIIFFFGAMWCKSADCKVILQRLKELHKENLRRNMGIEVIYVSSDTSPDDFDAFYKTQGGWFAVPFQDDLAEQLRRIFGITTIPNIIVVKKNGEIITKAGRQELVEKGLNVLVTWTD
ncbi:nucleoredoxin-like protein 2 [Tribolium madens]|uniref:nucleoredoxin-like protein 2 n=1 Tax=Tribolium madens TaxID=41895 RepID=UPI001CF73B46|nr:nucleoredoxin-like protein 2 [Tribolium madens]